jgi:hypothetical protein
VRALAFLGIVFHSSLFDATVLHFLTSKILMSCYTYLILGLPTILVPSGLVLNTFLILLLSVARTRCPSHSILFTFINVITSGSLNNLYSSRFVRIRDIGNSGTTHELGAGVVQ